MSALAIVMMVSICGLVWGGLSLLVLRALLRSKSTTS